MFEMTVLVTQLHQKRLFSLLLYKFLWCIHAWILSHNCIFICFLRKVSFLSLILFHKYCKCTGYNKLSSLKVSHFSLYFEGTTIPLFWTEMIFTGKGKEKENKKVEFQCQVLAFAYIFLRFLCDITPLWKPLPKKMWLNWFINHHVLLMVKPCFRKCM